METVERIFDRLPLEAVRIRTEVFIDEQGFKDEFDEIDDTAIHLVLYNNDKEPTDTCRSSLVGRRTVILFVGYRPEIWKDWE